MAAEAVRVVHMAAYGGPYSGSFVPMLSAARDAVEARGWRFEAVFAPGADRYAWYPQVTSEGMRTRVLHPRRGLARVKAVGSVLAEWDGATIVHTHFTLWDMPALLAALRRPSAHVVWHFHTGLQDDLTTRAKNIVRFGAAGRLVDRILCVGPGIYAKALQRLAPSGRTRLLPNGVDVRRFPAATAQERAAARVRLGLPPEAPILLLFAWHWVLKGGALALSTLRELRRAGLGVTLAVVGSPAEVRASAAQLGLAEAVVVLEPTEEVALLYAAADVLLAASPDEGFGFSMLESLCCGTPVVASDTPGHRYAGARLSACRLAPPDASELARAVAQELSAPVPDRAERLANSRAVIESELSLGAWSRQLLTEYDEILGAQARRPAAA